MNKKEKLLLLATQMNGEILVGEPQIKPNLSIIIDECGDAEIIIRYGTDDHRSFDPYDPQNKDQFAAILLKFYPNVHNHITKRGAEEFCTETWMKSLTQTDILNEIGSMFDKKL